jgi:ABC-type transporter Mla maintaining outer membrane lipid asymmetry ATPase subunit MlaF
LRKMDSTNDKFAQSSASPRTHGQEGDGDAESVVAKVDESESLTPAIEFRNVHFSFDDKKVLDDISFAVEKSEIKIILSGSGGGKSTILKLILGLLKPDAGQIFVDGEEITNYDETEMQRVRDKIGMVFQEDVSSILVTHEMDVVKYITSAYAVVGDDGKITVKDEGDKLCLTNTSILMLRKGRVIFNGVEEELVKAEDPYIQEFIRGTEVEIKTEEK